MSSIIELVENGKKELANNIFEQLLKEKLKLFAKTYHISQKKVLEDKYYWYNLAHELYPELNSLKDDYFYNTIHDLIYNKFEKPLRDELENDN